MKDNEPDTRMAEENCSLCGQCMAVCPTGALVHCRLDLAAVEDIDEATPIKGEEFIRFLRMRRSHRQFEDFPVPRTLLEKIALACRLAPAGSNDPSGQPILKISYHFRPSNVAAYRGLIAFYGLVAIV